MEKNASSEFLSILDQLGKNSETVTRVERTTLDGKLIDLKNRVDELGAFASAPIPTRNGKSALDYSSQGADALSMAFRAAYPEDIRRQDNQRTVRIRDAALAIYSAEEMLLSSEIQSPLDAFFSPFTTLFKTLSLLLEHRKRIAKVLGALTEHAALGHVAVFVALAAIVLAVHAALVSNDIVASLERTKLLRAYIEDFLRERALPQSSATRYRRRKRAR